MFPHGTRKEYNSFLAVSPKHSLVGCAPTSQPKHITRLPFKESLFCYPDQDARKGGRKMLFKIYDMLKGKEEGATAVEYGIMVALIAVVIIAAVTLLGTQLSAMFMRIASSLGG